MGKTRKPNGRPTSPRPDKYRERLACIAERLEAALDDVDRGFIYLSQSDAEVLVAAFNAFLSGKVVSLDVAFGVKRGRGAPKTGPADPRTMELVRKAMFRGTKSWKDVANEMGELDVRNLQRLVQRHKDYVIEEVAREIVEQMSTREP